VLRYTDLGRRCARRPRRAPIAAAFGIRKRRNSLLLASTCSAWPVWPV
jgi:hypothetical protein